MVLLVGAVLMLLPVMASADREADREAFKSAWSAAARGDQATVMTAIVSLRDYPLTPYLEYELLRQRVDQVPEVVMSQFLARHRDWSFAGTLELVWLRSLGRRGEFSALRRHVGSVGDIEVRCWLGRADLAEGNTEHLSELARELWLVGRSQPRACDPLFAWWRRQGNPVAEVAWQRFHLSLRAGETDLAGYLRRYLDSDQRHWSELWLKMQSRPYPTLREARQWRDHEQARLIVLYGLQRLARSDWARAEDVWQQLKRHLNFEAEDVTTIEREIALFRAVALDPEAIDSIDALPESARDQQILEWRARAAMAQGEWQEVLESIQSMSLEEQARGRWRYWRGRALSELNRPEALIAFSSLAAEANYYGFLSAVRTGQPLTLCNEDLQADAGIQRRLMRDAEFERALELFLVGQPGHARRTWAQLSRRLGRDELHQAALLAAGQGWHDRAIAALGSTGNMRAYPWRFPMIEKGRVLGASQRWSVDPALVYGLMRAESAMQSDARSPAGALGLLQLMPNTATAVASRNGLQYGGAGQLTDPAVNINLGVAHLAELLQRYEGNWPLVAAAYNAGAGAVGRWLNERPRTEPDVWLETLPFFETRDYVPRVLAFATIYEWQLEREPRLLIDSILPGQASPGAGFECQE